MESEGQRARRWGRRGRGTSAAGVAEKRTREVSPDSCPFWRTGRPARRAPARARPRSRHRGYHPSALGPRGRRRPLRGRTSPGLGPPISAVLHPRPGAPVTRAPRPTPAALWRRPLPRSPGPLTARRASCATAPGRRRVRTQPWRAPWRPGGALRTRR